MPGVRQRIQRQCWSLAGSAIAVVVLTLMGCGGERRSGAVSGDSANAPALDTTSAHTGDTAPVSVPESTTAAARDTTPSASTSTGPAKTPPKKVAATPAPKPSPAKPAKPVAPTAAAPAQPSDSGGTATSSADSSTSALAQTSQADAPLRDPYHQAPLDTVSQEVYNGWKQFNLNCARCHGEDVQGTTIAPHLIVSLRPEGPINTKELFVQTVCAGRPAKGMPSWCALGMDMEKINQIYSYVKGRSDSKIHPGRPAVKTGG
jgi:mono/diheme cytochrome c family protein